MNEDKATRYQRLRRRAGAASVAWTAALFTGLLLGGFSTRLRDGALSAAAWLGLDESWAAGAVVYGAALAFLHEAGGLPLAWYEGFVLERRYGLSAETARRWVADQLKSSGLVIVLAGGATALLYACIRWSPAHWWLPAAATFTLLMGGLAHLAPLVLLPLFYDIRTLDHEALRVRLTSLAERAGTRVLGVYRWGLGRRTRKANAALTGLGATRRILLSDTMLAEYSEEEIEVVLAHELAHHVHGDIWTGLVIQSGVLLAACYAAAWVLETGAGPLGLGGTADVAGLPLVLLTAGTTAIAALPALRWLSRAHERRADRLALELTRNPTAFVSALRRLAAQNLAEENPSRLVRWLFCSHPPAGERIAAARAFRA